MVSVKSNRYTLCPGLVLYCVMYYSTFLSLLIGEDIDVGHGQLCEAFGAESSFLR